MIDFTAFTPLALSQHLQEIVAKFAPKTDGTGQPVPPMSFDEADALYEEASEAFTELGKRQRRLERAKAMTDDVELAFHRGAAFHAQAYAAHLKFVPPSDEEEIVDGKRRPLATLSEHAKHSWTDEERGVA